MEISLLSTIILLLILLDPIGNVPIFVSMVEGIDPKRRKWVIARECLIGYLTLLLFTLAGNKLMGWMHLSDYAMGIAGGIILFIIAFKMIFRKNESVFGDSSESEPLVFPLAVPLFAGPSAISFVLLLTSKAPERMMEWVVAVTAGAIVSTIVLTLGSYIDRFIGKRGMRAVETLLGLLLTAVATQMLLDGIGVFLQHIDKQ